VHKIHLLLLSMKTNIFSILANDPNVQAIILSFLPLRFHFRDNFSKKAAEKVVRWFASEFETSPLDDVCCSCAFSNLTTCGAEQLIDSIMRKSLAQGAGKICLVALLRSLGANARIVSIMDPISHRAAIALNAAESRQKPILINACTCNPEPFIQHEGMELAGKIVGERQVCDIDEAVRIALRCPAVVAFTLKNNHATFYHSGVELKKKKKASAWRKPSTNHCDTTNVIYLLEEERHEAFMKASGFQAFMEKEIEVLKKDNPSIKAKRAVVLSTKKWDSMTKKQRDSFRRGKKRKKNSVFARKRRKIVRNFSPTQGLFIEVFVEKEKQWFVIKDGKLHEDARDFLECHNMAYFRAVDVNGYGKDVSPRYCERFSEALRRRPDKKWYRDVNDLLNVGRKKAKEHLEICEESLETLRFDEPVPVSLNALKNHPLYCVERFLKKNECLHPKGDILGIVKGNLVYARKSVQTLKSERDWFKLGFTIKEGEKEKKVVMKKENEIKLYGQWQCAAYVPPKVENGVIPTNSYGNYELWSPAHLPEGCVHMPYSGIAATAKQLGVQFAKAMTGFEYKRSGAHPIFEGIIVLEKDKDMLFDAYNAIQQVKRGKAEEKRFVKASTLWRTLVTGIMVRQKLHAEGLMRRHVREPGENEEADEFI